MESDRLFTSTVTRERALHPAKAPFLAIWNFLQRWQLPSESITLGWKIPLLLFFSALSLRLGFLLANGMFLLPDSCGRYLPIGISIFDVWRGSVYDTPGYPLLIGILYALFKSGLSLALTQAALSSGTVVFIWAMGRRLGLGRFALVPTIYLILNPAEILFANSALSETLFSFLVTGSVWAWTRLTPRSGHGAYVLLGLFTAAATLTRANGMLLWAVYGGITAVLCLHQIHWRRWCSFMLTVLLPVSAWIAVNYRLQELPRISQGSGWQFLQAMAYFDLIDPLTIPAEDRELYSDWLSLSQIRNKHLYSGHPKKVVRGFDGLYMAIAVENVKRDPQAYYRAMKQAFWMPRHEVFDFVNAPLNPEFWNYQRDIAVQAGYGSWMKPADPERWFNRTVYSKLMGFNGYFKYSYLQAALIPILLMALLCLDLRTLVLAAVPLGNGLVLLLMLNAIDRYLFSFEPLIILGSAAVIHRGGLWLFGSVLGVIGASRAAPKMPLQTITPGPIPARAKGLIIIPAYNEAANLPGLIERCRLLSRWEILVVNDCSTDDSEAVINALGVPAIHLPVNLGIGGAMQTGYRYAFRNHYPFAVQIDGDGQHDPNQLDLLLERLEEADCVIGSRFIEGKGFQSSGMRQLGIRIISAAIRFSTGKIILDCTSGMRLVNRRVIRLFNDYYPADYPEPESLAMLLRAGYRVREAAVVMEERNAGQSSIRGYKTVMYMLQVVPKVLLSALFRRYDWNA